MAAVDCCHELPAWRPRTTRCTKRAYRVAAANKAYHVVGWPRAAMREQLGIEVAPVQNDPLDLSPDQRMRTVAPELAQVHQYPDLAEAPLLAARARLDRGPCTPGPLPTRHLLMRHFPAFLDLADRSALVVGTGAVARRKARLLTSAGAEFHVAPQIQRRAAVGPRGRASCACPESARSNTSAQLLTIGHRLKRE